MMRRAVLAAALCLATASVHAETDASWVGRYQMLPTTPVIVLDTVTGQLWSLTADPRGGHHMRRVCYRSPGGHLLTRPHEELVMGDPERDQAACAWEN
jgi:hypothetical protein